jgi:hypothetical protein
MKAILCCFLALLLATLPGCIDAAAMVLLLQKKSKPQSAAPASAAPVDPSFHVWIAEIPDAATATAQETQLKSNGGIPDPLIWTQVGTGTESTVFTPTQAPGSFNAVLVQVNSAQNYLLDAVEILDPSDIVIGTASGTVYETLVTSPGNVLGPPDGQTGNMTGIAGQDSFVFTLFPSPIARFRIDIGTGVPASGDVLFASQLVRPGNQIPGGAAFDPSGNILVTFGEPAGTASNVFLARLDPSGNPLGTFSLCSGVTAAAGSHTVAVHTDGAVYVAVTAGNGTILAKKYSADLSTQLWSVTFSSGLGSDRVEAHGLAIDKLGNAIVAGGANTLLDGIDPWMRKIKGSTDSVGAGGNTLWTQTPSLLSLDLASTWWRGVTVDSQGDVYSTGNLSSLATSSIEVITRKSSGGTGAPLWSTQFNNPGPGPDVGNAVGLDSTGNVYVGGALGSSTQGKDTLLLKYSPTGFPDLFTTYNGPASQDDVIRGLAVDADGTVYAAGYVTATGPLQVLWLRKFDPSGGLVWTRTYAGPGGNDQASSVLLGSSTVVVVGFETLMGGETDIIVRCYAK